jgi:hypothetical protein
MAQAQALLSNFVIEVKGTCMFLTVPKQLCRSNRAAVSVSFLIFFALTANTSCATLPMLNALRAWASSAAKLWSSPVWVIHALTVRQNVTSMYKN